MPKFTKKQQEALNDSCWALTSDFESLYEEDWRGWLQRQNPWLVDFECEDEDGDDMCEKLMAEELTGVFIGFSTPLCYADESGDGVSTVLIQPGATSEDDYIVTSTCRWFNATFKGRETPKTIEGVFQALEALTYLDRSQWPGEVFCREAKTKWDNKRFKERKRISKAHDKALIQRLLDEHRRRVFRNANQSQPEQEGAK